MRNPNNCENCDCKSNSEGDCCCMLKSENNESCAKKSPFVMEMVTKREAHPNAFFKVPVGTKLKINFRGL